MSCVSFDIVFTAADMSRRRDNDKNLKLAFDQSPSTVSRSVMMFIPRLQEFISLFFLQLLFSRVSQQSSLMSHLLPDFHLILLSLFVLQSLDCNKEYE